MSTRPRRESPANGRTELLPHHRDELYKSGLSDEQLEACGFFSSDDPKRVAELLHWTGSARALGPCWFIPFFDAMGNATGHVVAKPDKPRPRKGGKPGVIKYESPLKQPIRVFIPPQTRSALADPTVPLIVTEGMKKAAKADQEGFPCLGLVGVEAWSKRRRKDAGGKAVGKRELLPELAEVAWKDRPVWIIYDSDLAEKPEVARAEWSLSQALTAAGAKVKVVRLPSRPDGAKAGLDDFLVDRGCDALRLLLETARPPAPPDKKDKVATPKQSSVADTLVRLAVERCEVWNDSLGRPFATPKGGAQHLRADQPTFRQWLAGEYFDLCEKASPQESLHSAANVVVMRALRGPTHPVFVRVAEHEGAVLLDLGDATYRAVRVAPGGWEVVNPPHPVRFLRPRTMHPLPLPQRGGAIEDFKPFLNTDEAGLHLVVGFMVACWRATGPHPILILTGGQGTGKTSVARFIKQTVDPAAADVRATPRCEQDLAIGGANNQLLAFDNLSHVPPWISDTLCRLATGGGFSARSLYETEGETVWDIVRPAILTGIGDYADRSDLLDRSILIGLQTIKKEQRLPERKLKARYAKARPKLLGHLLDRVATALRHMPTIDVGDLPRMADVVEWVVASEGGNPRASKFLAAFRKSIGLAHETALEGCPVVEPLRKFLATRGAEWLGTMEELLEALTERTTGADRNKFWPKLPKGLSQMLRRVAPNLPHVGIEVEFDIRSGDKDNRKLVGLRCVEPRQDASDAADASAAEDSRAGGVRGDAPDVRPTVVADATDESLLFK